MCIDQKSSSLPLVFMLCGSTDGAAEHVSPHPVVAGRRKGWIQPGVALRWRVSDPLPTLPLPGGVQPAHLLASGEHWPRGIQGMVTARCWVLESRAGVGVTAVPPAVEALHGCRRTGTLWHSPWLLWQSVGTRCSEARLAAVPSEEGCVLQHIRVSLALFCPCCCLLHCTVAVTIRRRTSPVKCKLSNL